MRRYTHVINIKVLGTGCPKCQRVEQHAVAALETLAEGNPSLEATIQHVTDLTEIADEYIRWSIPS
jgi:hypothetical protein